MKKILAAVAMLCVAFAVHAAESSRVTMSFDADWRFLKADATGAEKPEFDDSAWRKLDVPHDWSIEGAFSETNKTGGAGGWLPAGVGWYRKQFSLPGNFSGRKVFVEFDGVMANSDVWINGKLLGHRPFGYVSFSHDLTPHLNRDGKANVLAVRADNSRQPASRWYAGAGIYRHTRLVVTDLVHIEAQGVTVSTSDAGAANATVKIHAAITNESAVEIKIALRFDIIDPDGKRISQTMPVSTIPPGMQVWVDWHRPVARPQLWNLDSPKLYRLVTQVLEGEKILDEETVTFGIRDARFDAATGFWLNGKNLKLKGVCLHHDGGAFGAAVPNAVWVRRLKALRELGVNAIRTAHNPPSPDFLDLCDRMGFLVMDEFFDCWTIKKNPYDYHLHFNEWSQIDARDTIRRDRNHPCIVLWSVGNEIHDTPKAELAKKILAGLVAVVHENDPTRPVTQALFRPNVSHDYDNGLADMLDVIGTNYRDNELLDAWRAKPSRKIIGTEQGHTRATWLLCRDNPQHAGQFLWSGIDYLGESRRWPLMAAGSGLLDRTGTPKPSAFERQSWWSDKPMVRIARRITAGSSADEGGFGPLDRRQTLFCDWTPKNLQPHDESVEVYSNCEEVELFLNGKSLGKQQQNADDLSRVWKIPFQPGALKAVARNQNKIAATHELRTAGKPAKIILATDRAKLSRDWDDVACVTASVVDKDGVVVPSASDLITFKTSGAGRVVAVDSADNASHEAFQAGERRAYQGRCFAFVKAAAAGKIKLTASAPGLAGASVTIETPAK